MKVAPIVDALNARKEMAQAAVLSWRVSIMHTGRHYDPTMAAAVIARPTSAGFLVD
jgi:hypothetical protein